MKIEEIQDNKIFTENVKVSNNNSQRSTKDYIELDIDKLIKFGVVQRNFTIGNIVFTLSTLTEEARSEIDLLLPPDSENIDIQKRLALLKVPLLTQSIISINNVKFETPEAKKQLEQILRKMQTGLVDKLFGYYLELLQDQQTLLESGLKKNS